MMSPVRSNGSCDVEESGHNETQDSVDIRNIMMHQETVFKEQVQALHRLYNVQKHEMQELKKRKHQLTLETAVLTDGFSPDSGLGDRSGELVRPVARWYKQESGSLSLHPFCSLKLFESTGSISFGGSFERLDRPQNNPTRGFDLDKFLEDWADESVVKIQHIDCSTIREGDKSEKSHHTPEDGLSTNWPGKVASVDATAAQDSSPSDHIDKKIKLSHQGSFASVNGGLNSSSSEGEENNSKVADAFKITEGHHAPPTRPQDCSSVVSSEGHSKFVPGARLELSPNISSKGGNEYLIDMPDKDEPYCLKINSRASPLETEAIAPFKLDEERNADSKAARIEPIGIQVSTGDSSNPWERKHSAEIVGAKAVCDKNVNFSKSDKRVPSRSAP
uniref:Uncharacterized protein n=1 Tax=Kalanchoe fedtschenkoi TaxID=63787 RepID=A0A7N0R8G6_KALFE